MQIEETENDILAVKAFDKQRDNIESTLHPDLPQPPMTILAVGSKGSGKTTLLLRLLFGNKRPKNAKNKHYKFFRNYFDKIYVFSHTFSLDPKCAICKIPESQIFEDPERYEEIIEEILNGQRDEIESEGRDDAPRILFVFSDLAGSKLFSQKKGVMKRLAYNHRHYHVSLIIDSQGLREISPSFRSNLDGAMLFEGSNKKELAKFVDEYMGKYSPTEAEQILDYVFKDSKYNFLYANFQKRGKLYKNFNGLQITVD
jgi:energy-coupling factor transporter ATP-binding protein EcfA2